MMQDDPIYGNCGRPFEGTTSIEREGEGGFRWSTRYPIHSHASALAWASAPRSSPPSPPSYSQKHVGDGDALMGLYQRTTQRAICSVAHLFPPRVRTYPDLCRGTSHAARAVRARLAAARCLVELQGPESRLCKKVPHPKHWAPSHQISAPPPLHSPVLANGSAAFMALTSHNLQARCLAALVARPLVTEAKFGPRSRGAGE